MTTTRPVVLDAAPPFERSDPRVMVTHYPGTVNRGDGLQRRFVVQYGVECRTETHEKLRSEAAAVRRAATVTRDCEPNAVWLLDYDRTQPSSRFDAAAWRPLERAAADVGAALVAWTR